MQKTEFPDIAAVRRHFGVSGKEALNLITSGKVKIKQEDTKEENKQRT